MKQTAIEWLIEQTRTPDWHSLKRVDIIEQAKEMEKEQITDAYIEGGRKGFNFFGDDYEQYYNETYTQSSE